MSIPIVILRKQINTANNNYMSINIVYTYCDSMKKATEKKDHIL